MISKNLTYFSLRFDFSRLESLKKAENGMLNGDDIQQIIALRLRNGSCCGKTRGNMANTGGSKGDSCFFWNSGNNRRTNGIMTFCDKIPLKTKFEKVRIARGSSVPLWFFLAMAWSWCHRRMWILVRMLMKEPWSTATCWWDRVAQIGKRVHLSAGVQIGGVLGSTNNSTIIEDDAFIGAGCIVVEGYTFLEGGTGVVLGASTKNSWNWWKWKNYSKSIMGGSTKCNCYSGARQRRNAFSNANFGGVSHRRNRKKVKSTISFVNFNSHDSSRVRGVCFDLRRFSILFHENRHYSCPDIGEPNLPPPAEIFHCSKNTIRRFRWIRVWRTISFE